MKSSDWVANLIKKETDVVFCGTGGVCLHLMDSLSNAGIKIVLFLNEQGAAFAADAYSRLTGKLGVCVSTSGPGALNLISGTAGSYFDSIPILVITGQVVKNQLNEYDVRQFGFQEINVKEIFKTLTKRQYLVSDANQIKYSFKSAIKECKSGRQGPVVIDFCDDMQRVDIPDGEYDVPGYSPSTTYSEISDEIEKIARLLVESKRPALVLGRGARSAGKAAIQDFVNSMGIPTFLTWSTLDLLGDNYTFNMRDFGVSSQRSGNYIIQNSDLLICIGTRLDTHMCGSNYSAFAPNAKKVVVDVDNNELYFKRSYDVPVCCDSEVFIKNWCTTKLYLVQGKFHSWVDKCRQLRDKYPICKSEFENDEKVNPYWFLDKLSKIADKNATIITDAGGTLIQSMQGWKIKDGQRLITMENNSPMGYSIPASIGAWLSDPTKPLIVTCGDYSSMMNIQELALIKDLNIPVKIFIFNNHEMNIMKGTQRQWLSGRYVATEKPEFDIVNIANGFGIKTYTINNHNELNLLEDIMSEVVPCLISVEIKKESPIEPKLTFGKSIEYQSPELPVEEHNEIIKNLMQE